MKSLNEYINEKLVIFPSQVDEKLVIFPSQVDEKLVINKNFKEFKRDIIKVNNDNVYETVRDETLKQLKKSNSNSFPINLNHIDVSEVTDFDCLFDAVQADAKKENNDTLRYIDISEWDVRKVSSMRWMFSGCKDLVSVGDLSNWKIDNLEWAEKMFNDCENLEYIGDLSRWDIENNYGPVDIANMFSGCKKLKKLPSWYSS